MGEEGDGLAESRVTHALKAFREAGTWRERPTTGGHRRPHFGSHARGQVCRDHKPQLGKQTNAYAWRRSKRAQCRKKLLPRNQVQAS
jgi:hypothetical protein